MPIIQRKTKLKKNGDIIVIFHGIEEDLKRQFKAQCARENITMTNKLKQIIRKSLENPVSSIR